MSDATSIKAYSAKHLAVVAVVAALAGGTVAGVAVKNRCPKPGIGKDLDRAIGVAGQTFNDVDGNHLFNSPPDTVAAMQKVWLYGDTNDNCVFEANQDVSLSSVQSDASGNYTLVPTAASGCYFATTSALPGVWSTSKRFCIEGGSGGTHLLLNLQK